MKIALVEDNPHLARSLKENLSAFENVEVLFVASNGQDALQKLASQTPDIVLMDINMPVMNGIEATKRVKHHFPAIKIIMLTVFDEAEKIFDAILAGACGYLLKDEKPEKILSALEEAMEGGAPMSPSIASKSLSVHIAENGNEKISFEVKDDGRGIGTANNNSGYGIKNMQDRIKELNGEMMITSSGKDGTSISFTVPLGNL